MQERQEIIALDAEIYRLQRQLTELEAVKARLAELLEKRKELLDAFDKKARERPY